jgi:hypothetical protein
VAVVVVVVVIGVATDSTVGNGVAASTAGAGAGLTSDGGARSGREPNTCCCCCWSKLRWEILVRFQQVTQVGLSSTSFAIVPSGASHCEHVKHGTQ